MSNVIYIRNDQLTHDLLAEIIKVKSVAWPYCYEDQVSWIKSNLKDSAVHVLLLQNQKVVAYLNLIEIELLVNTFIHNSYGIGNVCVLEKGDGWGGELIKHINIYLKSIGKIGLLFCNNQLVKFYSANNWRSINEVKLIFQLKSNEHVMVFNLPENFNQIEYHGTPF